MHYVTEGNLYDDNALENIYSYSANLAATPALQAGTQYWISIIGNTSGDNGWSWISGEPGDGTSYQIDGTDASQDGVLQYDRSFNLSNPSAAPESSSLTVFLVASILLIVLRLTAFFTQKKVKNIV
jgi:hypothetical protein